MSKTTVVESKTIDERGRIAASRFLECQGFTILEKEWFYNIYGVDIIAEEENQLVFIEVKTCSNSDMRLPEESVDNARRTKLEQCAAAFLSERDYAEMSIRFDVMSILVIGDDRAFLRHHRNAYALG